MNKPRDVTFYFEPALLKSAEAGQHNFVDLISKVLNGSGLQVFFHDNIPEARAASADLPGYAIYHMDDPNHERALTMRRHNIYPFWQIEQSVRRWKWGVAITLFSDKKGAP